MISGLSALNTDNTPKIILSKKRQLQTNFNYLNILPVKYFVNMSQIDTILYNFDLCGDMNYKHGYHAGNFADVVKHILLQRLFFHAIEKQKPLRYIDTHAGNGLYHLESEEALRTGEWVDGIQRLKTATLSTDLYPS
jgi:hypothetical protein